MERLGTFHLSTTWCDTTHSDFLPHSFSIRHFRESSSSWHCSAVYVSRALRCLSGFSYYLQKAGSFSWLRDLSTQLRYGWAVSPAPSDFFQACFWRGSVPFSLSPHFSWWQQQKRPLSAFIHLESEQIPSHLFLREPPDTHLHTKACTVCAQPDPDFLSPRTLPDNHHRPYVFKHRFNQWAKESQNSMLVI